MWGEILSEGKWYRQQLRVIEKERDEALKLLCEFGEEHVDERHWWERVLKFLSRMDAAKRERG